VLRNLTDAQINRAEDLRKIHQLEQALDPGAAEKTIEQTAKELGVSKDTVRGMFQSGDQMKPFLRFKGPL
jgi:HAMP domain-containing protein